MVMAVEVVGLVGYEAAPRLFDVEWDGHAVPHSGLVLDSASLVAERVRSSRTVAMTSIQTAQRLCTAGPDLTEAE